VIDEAHGDGAQTTRRGGAMVRFTDRVDAGRRLAQRLAHLRSEDLVVLGLPRGGVPVAFQVASELGAPLDVLVVRKLGVPYQPELAMGAIGEGGVRVVNEGIVQLAGVTEPELAEVEKRASEELARRAERFRRGRDRVSLAGRTALIVDDGIATGSTARAACLVARAQGASRIVLAAPVAPVDISSEMRDVADEVVVLETPSAFGAIGQFYIDFTQVPDDEVVRLLSWAPTRADAAAGGLAPAAADPPGTDTEVIVSVGGTRVGGHLTVPDGASAIVVFAHGSGSSRHSPRNRYVARVLNDAGLGTLLFDLLTPDEELDRANVFDIPLLARRLTDVSAWLRAEDEGRNAAIGYFGASTGAGAALWAAAEPDSDVKAVVSRGGRPDLAAPRLGEVRAPTLLIVGGDDTVVLQLNREARAQMRCETELRVVPGASHLFEEPGTLDAAAQHARDWFVDHLTSVGHGVV
jgi:putative phosphoribosyl transferase